ncbi:hypothetical protein L209DRAFT_756952 [Thermothelomyces heterothallicus CBS 203.75]
MVYATGGAAIHLAGIAPLAGNLATRRPGSWAPNNSPEGFANAKGKSVETDRRHSTKRHRLLRLLEPVARPAAG